MRGGHGQPGRRVAGPQPVELEPEARPIAARRVGAVRDHERADPLLAVGADPEEGRALRRTHPLVQVAGVVRGAKAGDIQLHHAGRVRAVDQRVDPALRQRGNQLLHRQHQRRGRRDVVEHRQTGSRRDGAHHGRHHRIRRFERERNLRHDHAGAAARRHVVKRVAHGVVLMVGGQQLVARLEAQRAQHRIDPGGGVGDERQVIGPGTDEGTQRGSGRVQRRLEPLDHEANGLVLQLEPPRGLSLQHHARGGAVRAVVQEVDARIERPVAGVLGRHRWVS